MTDNERNTDDLISEWFHVGYRKAIWETFQSLTTDAEKEFFKTVLLRTLNDKKLIDVYTEVHEERGCPKDYCPVGSKCVPCKFTY